MIFLLYTSTLSGLFVIAASNCLFLKAIVDWTCSIFWTASAVIFPNKPLIIWTTAKVSIIKNVNAQFQIFLIPNQIGPKIAAYRLNEYENVGLLPIFWNCSM